MALEKKVELLGRVFPTKPFPDMGHMLPCPYERVDGKEYPVIFAAAVVAQKGNEYLMVKEADKGLGGRSDEGKYAWPGGGKEDADQNLVQTAEREFAEETPWIAQITNLIGVYKRINARMKLIYKAAFEGLITAAGDANLEADVTDTQFFSADEISELAREGQLKTKDVLRIFDDYCAKKRYALDQLNSPDVITDLTQV